MTDPASVTNSDQVQALLEAVEQERPAVEHPDAGYRGAPFMDGGDEDTHVTLF